MTNITERNPPPTVSGGFDSGPNSRANLRELWQARHLVRQMMLRDLKVRYRQTWLGGLWAILSPTLNLCMYYAVFGLMIRMNTPDYQAPYVLVLLSGLVLWGLFQSLVNAVGDSLLNNLHLVKKIYFPRTALTVACMGISLVDFAVALLLLLGLSAFFGVAPGLTRLPALVLCVLLILLAARGLGCLLAVAKVRFRDIQHLTPLVMQALFYATPVVWTPGLWSARMQNVLALNPLYGLCALFRWSLAGGPLPGWPVLLWSVVGSLLMAVIGDRLFVRYEAQVIDRE